MASNSSAGVYVREIDASQVVSPASTSVGAMVGDSNRGPVNQRTLVTSVQKFIRQFGEPDATLGFMHHSAVAFLNEADRLYVTRVDTGALTGGATIYIGETTLNAAVAWEEGSYRPVEREFDIDDLLHFYAVDPGVWNNGVTIRVYPNTQLDDGSFIVDVFEGIVGNSPAETFTVTMDWRIDGYGVQLNVQENINRRSQLIRCVQNAEQREYVKNPTRRFITAVNTIKFGGGTNGTKATTGQNMQAWEQYRDPEQLNVNMLIGAGQVNPAVQQRMDEICRDRMDCMAILDMPAMSQEVQQAIDHRRNNLGINSSYSALYSCDLLVLDTYSNRRLYVPPSGYVAAAYARTDRDFATWFAPAGLVRGNLRVLGTRHKYNQGDRDALVESQINPIRVIEGIGISIWGADTLQTMSSALSNVNVRRLMLYIEKSISSAVIYNVFDPNDEILRNKLVEIATRFLKPILDGRGLHAFTVICDESNNPPEVTAAGDLMLDIGLDPVLPAKRILINATINKTGSRFTATAGDA